MPKHGTPEKYNIFAMCGEQLMDLKSQSMKLLMILLSHDSTMGGKVIISDFCVMVMLFSRWNNSSLFLQ
jgi:hypothetical protein